jgi:hypothetical protein
VAKAARELQKDKGRGTVKSTEWSESDGLLMFHSKIYVPNDRDQSVSESLCAPHHLCLLLKLSPPLLPVQFT